MTRIELDVLLNDLHVGVLRYQDEAVEFELSEAYVELPLRPVLGQVFEDDLRKVHRVRSGVPPWFANLLPEGPLRSLIAGAAGVHPSRDLFLLAHLGEDLPGAVRVIGPEGLPPNASDVSADEPHQAVGEIVSSDYDLKFSLAGVQLKFSVLAGDRGVTLPILGKHGDLIVKLEDARYDGVPENEYSMMTWASAAGIEVPTVELIDSSLIEGLPADLSRPGTKAFVVSRFDRAPEGRVHMEDFAQVLNRPPTPAGKYGGANYETVANVVYALSGFSGLREFARRIVAIVAMGNGDAHLKNFSLLYADSRNATLAPAYDLVSTVTYVRGNETLALNLAKSKAFENVTTGSFRRLARRLGLSSESALDETVAEAVELLQEKWQALKSELPARPDVKAAIDARLKDLPLLQGQ